MAGHPTERREAEGTWQLRATVPVDDDGGHDANDAFTFVYRDGRVTLRLATLRAGQWRSADDMYELAATWDDDTLCYLPPFGDWTRLAVFEDGRFVDIGSGVRRVFERISDDDVVEWNRALTTAREPHDYRRRPDGRLEE